MKTEQEFEKAQQELVDKFKERLKLAADSVISDLYTDVVNYAASDAHVNFHNYLRDEFRASLIEEISSGYSHYSWAHSMRMELLKKHPEQIRNKIIDDLQVRIQSLEEHVEILQRNCR